MRTATLLFTILVWRGVNGAAAQSPVTAGERVRITSQRHGLDRVIGQVATATNDTVTILTEHGSRHETRALAFSDLDRLEIGDYEGRRTRSGVGIGFAAGATIGFLLGVATYNDCPPQQWCIARSAEGQGLLGAMVGGSVFGIAGGVIGTLTRAERWEEIPTRRTTVSVRALRAGGVGVGLAVHF